MITTKVLRNGIPQSGLNVYIIADIKLCTNGTVRDAITDENGEAKIDFKPSLTGNVIINRQIVHQGALLPYLTIHI
ncbi:hypothetical protein V2H45_04035 [Tumidithrix elongata RA019]|uniref:Uncharacterized protein n=1 Tax=Tumidithrix elongata BACA0141 TaxID=2716417 RepID=A0AAW9PYC4_9CYAN|nr:hypothetical protein [Tumidithrix elongata RA019]